MTEKDLTNIGFKKCEGDNFYYYTLDITPYFSFITNANDEIKDDKWSVYIFDDENIVYNDKNELINLINNLKRHIR